MIGPGFCSMERKFSTNKASSITKVIMKLKIEKTNYVFIK